MSIRDPGVAGCRGRPYREPVGRAAHTPLSRKANKAVRIVAVFVVLAFTVAGCAGSQEQGHRGAAGGEDAARPAQEAKVSRTDVRVPPMPADSDCADFQTRAQAMALLERDPS
jgi:hypothetical protein